MSIALPKVTLQSLLMSLKVQLLEDGIGLKLCKIHAILEEQTSRAGKFKLYYLGSAIIDIMVVILTIK